MSRFFGPGNIFIVDIVVQKRVAFATISDFDPSERVRSLRAIDSPYQSSQSVNIGPGLVNSSS